jgi:hypothetical protein
MPGVIANLVQLDVAPGKEDLAQEPIDGVDVISPSPCSRSDQHVLNQWPGRPLRVEFCGDAAKQIIDLPRIIARDSVVTGMPEPHIPDLITVHGCRATAVFGHQGRAAFAIARSMMCAARARRAFLDISPPHDITKISLAPW